MREHGPLTTREVKTFFDALHGVSIFYDGTYKEKNEKSLADQEKFKKKYWELPIDERHKLLGDMAAISAGCEDDV